MTTIDNLKELERDMRKQTHNLIASNYLSLEDLCECIESLEKQIPKKPIKDPINDFVIDGVMCEAWRNVCPICHHIIERPCDYDFGSVGNKCCGGCGQAIDWSDEE